MHDCVSNTYQNFKATVVHSESYATRVQFARKQKIMLYKDNQSVNQGVLLRGNMKRNLGCTPGVEFMYLVFTYMPGESYGRRLRSLLLCLCDVIRAQINSFVYCFHFYALYIDE